MKLLNALQELKDSGISELYGLHGTNNIDDVIANAERIAEEYKKYPDTWGKEKDDYKIRVIHGVTFIMSSYVSNTFSDGEKSYIPTYATLPDEEAYKVWKQSLNEEIIQALFKRAKELKIFSV